MVAESEIITAIVDRLPDALVTMAHAAEATEAIEAVLREHGARIVVEPEKKSAIQIYIDQRRNCPQCGYPIP